MRKMAIRFDKPKIEIVLVGIFFAVNYVDCVYNEPMIILELLWRKLFRIILALG